MLSPKACTVLQGLVSFDFFIGLISSYVMGTFVTNILLCSSFTKLEHKTCSNNVK